MPFVFRQEVIQTPCVKLPSLGAMGLEILLQEAWIQIKPYRP